MTSLLFIAGYYLLALLYFMLVQRPLFILATTKSNPAGKLTTHDLINIARFAIRSDAVGAVYICLIPTLTAIILTFVAGGPFTTTFAIVNLLSALIAGAAGAADPLLYRFWKSKIDASALHYLKSFRGVTASVSPLFIVGGLVLWLLLSGIFYCGAWLVTELTVASHPFKPAGIVETTICAFAAIVVVGLYFLILRGTGHRPKTPSVSYFSTNMYLNHCAVNTIYGFIYSLKSAGDPTKKFRFFNAEQCAADAKEYYPTDGSPSVQLLNTSRPNIVFVIWESLSWRHAKQTIDGVEILPNFNRLASEGVLFTRVDAGNIRTDRGLVCLLSGYLSPPSEAIIKYTRKLPLLPSLPRSLSANGYLTAAWHGGDLTFYHMKDYYLAAGFGSVLDLDCFSSESCRCKWGIHDEIVFDCVANEYELQSNDATPRFDVIQTLSSHEPFDVPYSRIPANKIANSFAYTDHCLGRFIDRMRASGAWNNTLIVVTGDHGFYHGDAIERDKYPHIPLLLTGGAVAAAPATIDTIMSQTDIAATLLSQLGIEHSNYPLSRDVLANTYRDRFSFHSHQTGFIVRNERGFTEFDLASGRAINGEDPARCRRGLVSLQYLHTLLQQI